MTAVSQSYPNYLGGLNEQPDELKKPGQLVEALNVIPDPVVGLTRRPGFKRLTWKNKQGIELSDQQFVDIDPRGTWFEMQRTNQVNNDYLYIGVINRDGSVRIFNQDGEFQLVKYVDDSILPHKSYLYNSNVLEVFDDNNDIIKRYDILDPDISYFRHEVDEPLKWCVSKDHIIFTNPTQVPTLSAPKQPSFQESQKYYSFISLKILDTENYNYTFRRFYKQAEVPDDNYSETSSIEVDDVSDLRDNYWLKDTTLYLQTESPFRLTLETPPGGVPAVVDLSFVGQVRSIKSDGGDGFYNGVSYTYTATLVDPGRGYKEGDVFREKLQFAGKPDLTVKFKVKRTSNVIGTRNDLVVPNVTNDMSAQDILIELGKGFEAVGIDKTVVVGNGLYLENGNAFSVDTTEIAVAECINSQKRIVYGGPDPDKAPICRVTSTAQLPNECYAGFIVQVSNSFDGKSDYYLEYKSESRTPQDNNRDDTVLLTKSDGYWEEIAKPWERVTPNNGTLPHMITVVRETDETEFVFIVSRIDYEQREAGTAQDNPSFFIDATPITDVTYYKNRLFCMTKSGTVVTSRAGQINNFFLNTAVSTSLIDPIDLVANSNQRVPIHGSAVVNNGLVLFGDSEQYTVTTNSDAFTSETVNITKVSNYTYNPVSEPIYLGTNLGFISDGLTRFYEMTNIYDRGPVDINERSQQIQAQFGQGFNMPVSSREQSMMIVYKKYRLHNDRDRSPDMYLYRFRQENSQESSQTSWVKWKTNKPVAYVTLPQDKMYVVVHTEEDGTDFYLMDSGTLAGTPAGPSSLSLVPNYTDGWTDDADGVPFETKIVFPTIYPRSRDKYDLTSNTTIHRLKLSTSAIGAYDLKIERKGYDTYNILVEQTPSDEYRANVNPLYGQHIETVPIYTRNYNLNVTMSTSYNAPMSLHSMTWEGDWNPPYYKRV